MANDNHYGPGAKGGQFAPKGGGVASRSLDPRGEGVFPADVKAALLKPAAHGVVDTRTQSEWKLLERHGLAVSYRPHDAESHDPPMWSLSAKGRNAADELKQPSPLSRAAPALPRPPKYHLTWLNPDTGKREPYQSNLSRSGAEKLMQRMQVTASRWGVANPNFRLEIMPTKDEK